MGMMREFIMGQFEIINEKQSVAKARIDEHDLKINMVMRNQDYVKNAAANGLFGGSGGQRFSGGNE